MKRLLFFICTLLCANVLMAQTYFWEGDLEYHVIGAGEVEVSDCKDSVTSVNIPLTVTHRDDDSVRTYSVTTIGPYAFHYCDSLTSVNIPNSDIIIYPTAFWHAGPSKYITIDSINYAVYVPVILPFNSNTHPIYGHGLVTLHIGDSTYRPTEAYVSYDNINISGHVNILSSIEIAGNTYPVTSIGSEAFKNCSTLTSVTIPNSVTSIENEAFSGCSSLTSVNIPNSVTEIGSSAFFDCSSLTSVNIGNSVTSIGEEAFRYCSSLTSVTIPNSVDSIGNYAFCGCPLTSITFLANNTYNFSDIFCISSNSNSTGSPITLYVPNGCRDDYENWENYFDCIIELNSDNSISNLEVDVNNEEWGSVEVYEECGTATLTAVVEMDCSEFLHWSDDNTDNPRVVNVVNNPSFTAIFKDPVLDTTIDATIMQGETYNFNGQELSEEGVYNATVLSVLGCEINLTVNLYVIPNNYTNGETSSLQETELEEIVFYPNPTKGLISFSKSIERIEVVDISGKILLSFSNVKEINIGDLPEGSYLLRLHSNENSVLRKIVKE